MNTFNASSQARLVCAPARPADVLLRGAHVLDPRTGIGLVGRSSVTVVARHGIDADSLTKVGSLDYDAGRLDEAERLFLRSRVIQEVLVRDHPGISTYRDDLAGSLTLLGRGNACIKYSL